MKFPHFVESVELAQIANETINQASYLQDCFVFYDPQLSLEYIYFGSHSQPMEIEKALKYGEILAATESPISVNSHQIYKSAFQYQIELSNLFCFSGIDC